MIRAGLLTLALALPTIAHTQQLDEEETGEPIILYHPTIEMIIVTAGGNLGLSQSDKVRSAQILGSISRVVGARVENQLRDEAGIAQFRRSDSRSANPTSQGVTLRGLGGNASSRALVMLDGVPQADPFGGWVAWSALDNIPLTGVRIVRGGGSGADGPGALGGTISLSSAVDEDARVAISGGSFGASDVVAGIGGALGDGSVAIDGRWSRGDGFVPIVAGQRGSVDRAAPYDQAGLGLRAKIDAGRSAQIEISVRGWRDRRSRGTDFTDSAVDGADASIRYVLNPAPYDGWQAILLGYAQLREFETGFASVAADRNSVTPALIQRVPSMGLGGRLELRPPIDNDNPLRIGIDWRRVEGETQEQFFFTGLTPGRRRVAGGSTTTVGGFADFYANVGDLLLSASARADHWRIAPGYRVERNIGGTLPSDDRFAGRSGWEGTGRVGLKVEGDVALRASAYTGWRLPTLNELYRPFRVGVDATAANELLRPERLVGAEAGLDWNGGDVSISVTGYWNRLDHAIANVTLGRGPGLFPGVGFVAAGGSYAQRQNLDAIVAKGAEAQARYHLGWLALRASYAYTDARVQSSGISLALDGVRPAQVARHAASISASADFDPAKFELKVRHIGAQNEDDLGVQKLRSATTIDAGASVDISETMALHVRAENLLDALVPAAIGAGGAIERASPRAIWFGVSARF